MTAGYNAYEPDDLELAQSVLDEVWASLPQETKSDSRATLIRERLARQVLAAINNERLDRDELKASLLETDLTADWA